MSTPFYRAFEDRHRGSRELIKGRLTVYLPFIERLVEIYPDCLVLDVGCGRGEWLELLGEYGVDARGIDQDLGMLEACQSIGLPAEQGDALEALRVMPHESVAAVTGFHIAEHIPFEQLQELFAEAFRIIKPAGLLILETPNAENLVVGAHSFYLDPTHERPIPQLLLSFLAENSGFLRNKILRFQEDPQLLKEDRVSLFQVLGGVSPDYAVVAQKKDKKEKLALFDELFSKEYGVSLDLLASKYDDKMEKGFRELEMKLKKFGKKVEEIDEKKSEEKSLDNIVDLTERLKQLELRASLNEEGNPIIRESLDLARKNRNLLLSLEEANEQRVKKDKQLTEINRQLQKDRHEWKQVQQALDETGVQLAEVKHQLNESLGNAHNWYLRAIAAEDQLNDITSSRSWRVTWPLRIAGKVVKRFVSQAGRAIKYIFRLPVSFVVTYLSDRPGMRARLNENLLRYPRLHSNLKKIYYNFIYHKQNEFSPSKSELSKEHDGSIDKNKYTRNVASFSTRRVLEEFKYVREVLAEEKAS